jgi:hypothetical protein
MTLRGGFVIIGNRQGGIQKSFGQYRKGSEDTGNIPDFIKVVSVKELCQGID